MPHVLLLAPWLAATLGFLKPYLWYLVFGLISLLLSKRSQLDHWAEQNPRLAGLMKLLRSTGLDPWLAVQALSLIVKGKLPNQVTAASKSIKPPPLVVLGFSLMLGASVLVAGCGPNARPSHVGSVTQQAAKGAYTGAVLAVRVLDQVAGDWMSKIDNPSPNELDAARAITKALGEARDMLKIGASCVNDDGACVEQLRAVLERYALVTKTLEAFGVKPPPELGEVLAFLQGYVGDGS